MRYVIQGLVIVLLLAILAGVAVLVLAVGSLFSVGTGVGGVTSQARGALTSAEQAIVDATDPNHPPRGVTYDTEFDALQILHVGDGLPGGTQYVLTIAAIRRRDNPESADTAAYAVVHAQLRQPRETRFLGQLIRSDADPRDHAVYKGEAFRIGRAVFRVNWISDAQSSLALATYRNPDTATVPLKFDYE